VAARKKEMMYLFLVLFAPALGAAPEDVKELAKEVHAFLASAESKTTDDWHKMQAHLMEKEKTMLAAVGTKKTAANQEAVKSLVALLKEWEAAQGSRAQSAKQRMDKASLQDLAQGLYQRRNLPIETQAAFTRRDEFKDLPVLPALAGENGTHNASAPMYQEVADWMVAKGYPSPELRNAEDRTARGKKLADIKKQVGGMLDALTTAAKSAPPAVRKELEASLATARGAHNVKDELDALQKAVPLFRKR
jgi:hypothetical protein